MVFDAKQLPEWFLVIAVIVLGGYAKWSLPKLFNGLTSSLKDFKESMDKMTEKLFQKADDHEHRLSQLEGEHNGWKDTHQRREKDRN